jgi:hypothetical protein
VIPEWYTRTYARGLKARGAVLENVRHLSNIDCEHTQPHRSGGGPRQNCHGLPDAGLAKIVLGVYRAGFDCLKAKFKQ